MIPAGVDLSRHSARAEIRTQVVMVYISIIYGAPDNPVLIY